MTAQPFIGSGTSPVAPAQISRRSGLVAVRGKAEANRVISRDVRRVAGPLAALHHLLWYTDSGQRSRGASTGWSGPGRTCRVGHSGASRCHTCVAKEMKATLPPGEGQAGLFQCQGQHFTWPPAGVKSEQLGISSPRSRNGLPAPAWDRPARPFLRRRPLTAFGRAGRAPES